MQHVVPLSSGLCVCFAVAFAADGSVVTVLGFDSPIGSSDLASTARSCVISSQSVVCLVTLLSNVSSALLEATMPGARPTVFVGFSAPSFIIGDSSTAMAFVMSRLRGSVGCGWMPYFLKNSE